MTPRSARQTLFCIDIIVASSLAIFRFTDAPNQLVVLVTSVTRNKVTALLTARLAIVTLLICVKFTLSAALPVLGGTQGIFVGAFLDHRNDG